MNLTRRQFELGVLAAAGSVAARGASRVAAQEQVAVKDVPWLAEVQRAPAQLPPDAPQLPPILIGPRGERITTRDEWLQRREGIITEWTQFLGSWDYPRRPGEFEIVTSDRTTRVIRRLIRYESERNMAVEAYLMLPSRVVERLPGVVVFHSTVDYTIRQGAGLEGDPAAAWGLRLAERGFVALCPRCFLWDDSSPPDFAAQVAQHDKRHPNTRGMAKMLYDGRRALDLLATVPEVDPNRLGAAGHSLGAKEALYLAAFDSRVKAAVFSEGGISTTFSNWHAPWYLNTQLRGHDHHELLGLVAPRAFLLIGGESADGAKSWPFIASTLEVYRLYGQPSRIGLFNHGGGHKIPPAAETRTYEWLQAYV